MKLQRLVDHVKRLEELLQKQDKLNVLKPASVTLRRERPRLFC